MDDGSVEDGKVATLRKTATKLVRASGELFPAEHLSKALKGVESAVVRPAITRLEGSAATGSADSRKQRLRAQCGALHRQLLDKKANEDSFLSNVMTFFREEDAKAMNHRMQIQDQLDQFEELRAHQAQQAKEEEALKACLELMVLYAEDAKSRNTFLIDTLTQLLSCQPTVLPGNPTDDTLVQSWGLAAQAAYIRLVNDCQFSLEKMLARRNMFLDRLEDSKKENKEHALQMAVLMQTTTNSREVLDEYKRRYFWDSITHSFKPPSRRIGETSEAASSKPQPAAQLPPLPAQLPQPSQPSSGLALPLRPGEPMPVQEPMPSPRTPSESSPSPRPQQESLPSLPEEQHPPPADQSQDSPAPASVDPASPSEGSFSRSAALASEGFTPPKGSSPEHSRSPPPSQVLLEPIAVPCLPPPPPLPLPRVSGGEGAATAHAAQASMRCQRHTYSLGPQPSRMHPQGCVSFSPPGVATQPAGAPTFSGWQVAQLPGHGSSYLPEQAVPQPRRHLAYSPPPRQWQQLSTASPRLPSPVPPPRWTYVSPRRSARSTSAGADSACRARGRHSSFEPRMHGQSLLGPAIAHPSLPGSMLCPTPGSAWSGSMHCPAPPPALGHILGVRSGSAAYPPGQVRALEPIEQRGRSPVPARRVVLAPQAPSQAAQPLAPRLCSQSPPRQVYLVRSPSPASQACITPRGTSPALAQSSSYILPVTRGSAPAMVGRGASGRTPSPCYPARMAKVSTSPCNIASGEGVLLTPRYAGAMPPAGSVQGTRVPDATFVARGRSPGLVPVAPNSPQYCVRQGASCAVRSPTPPAAVVAPAPPRTGSPVFVRYHLQPRTGAAGPQILPAQALSVQAPMLHGPCSVTMTSASNLRAG